MSMGDIWGWGGSTHGRMGREHGGGVMYNIIIGLPMVLIHFEPLRRGQPLYKGQKT